jgi:hypothetical protein
VLSHKSKVQQGSRLSGNESVALITRPQVQPRIRTADIQEVKAETTKIEAQTRHMRADLNRLKERIAGKSEDVVRVVKGDRGKKRNETVRNELQRRITSTKARVDRLSAELQDLRFDDRISFYEESVEELKTAFLEQERMQGEVELWKERARISEETLKEFDRKASPDGIRRQEEMLVHLVAQCDELRRKWEAYEVKMQKMDIEGRISRNRRLGVKARACRRDAREERALLASYLRDYDIEFTKERMIFCKRMLYLQDVIDEQRRQIVTFLMPHAESQLKEELVVPLEEEEISSPAPPSEPKTGNNAKRRARRKTDAGADGTDAEKSEGGRNGKRTATKKKKGDSANSEGKSDSNGRKKSDVMSEH